jgi:hypothetical protein
MTAFVDREGVELLFGCSSFMGTEAERYRDAFALLSQRHLAPRRWWPRVKAPEVFRFARRLAGRKPDLKRAMLGMPPLLRTYLVMGGWVSDHAVVDRDLNTMHVFTGLEIRKVPPARARLLRGVGVGQESEERPWPPTPFSLISLRFPYRFSAAASRASASTPAQSPLSTIAFGATQEPPTHITLASDK